MCCFVLGQIGDIKTAERYFQDVEKACQMKGSQPSHTTCVLMNRYVRVMHLAPSYSVRVLNAARDHFWLRGSGASFRAFCRFVLPPGVWFNTGGHTCVALTWGDVEHEVKLRWQPVSLRLLTPRLAFFFFFTAFCRFKEVEIYYRTYMNNKYKSELWLNKNVSSLFRNVVNPVLY